MPPATNIDTLRVEPVILDGANLELCPHCANQGWVSTTPRLPFGCLTSADHAAFVERERAEGVQCPCGRWDWRKGPKPVAVQIGEAA